MARKLATDDLNLISYAQKKFTDREKPQAVFTRRLEHVNCRNYSILYFYGVGGIGKTCLQNHLKKEHLDKKSNYIYSWLNFENSSNRKESFGLRFLADMFKKNFGVKFTTFNMAYTIYLEKMCPQMEISKKTLPYIEEGDILVNIMETITEIGGMPGLAMKIGKYLYSKSHDMLFNENIKNLLQVFIDTDEGYILERKLIHFFAYDINLHKEQNPNEKIIIFLDTYEALWEDNKKEANFLSADEWIRDRLVTEIKNVLFVICGRDKLRWEEDDKSWIEITKDGLSDLEQHIIGDLSFNDSKDFLVSCGIEEENIQNEIIKCSQGVPFYLDLCVDTYFRIEANGEDVESDMFKDIGKHEIFERFMRYLDREEVATLGALSVANFYNEDIFLEIIKEFNTGYPATDLNNINNFSFIKKENDNFQIHNLMKESLYNKIDNTLKNKINKFFLKYYEAKIKNIDIHKISELEEPIFNEIIYHIFKIEDKIELEKYYKKYFNLLNGTVSFYGHYIIIDLQKKYLNFLPNNIDKINKYNTLGTLYLRGFEDFVNAIQNHEEALRLSKKIGSVSEELESCFCLGNVYLHMEDYDKAYFYYEKILNSKNQHLSFFSYFYEKIGSLYMRKGNFGSAEHYYKNAIELSIDKYGELSDELRYYYQQIITLYLNFNKFEMAIEYLFKYLTIEENYFVYQSLQTAYEELGDNEKAEEYSKKVYEITRRDMQDAKVNENKVEAL